MVREWPVAGEIWRHFKGRDYRIVACPVIHTETQEQLVCYQALYGDYGFFVRPLAMFMGAVDREKYPAAEQEWRFMRK